MVMAAARVVALRRRSCGIASLKHAFRETTALAAAFILFLAFPRCWCCSALSAPIGSGGPLNRVALVTGANKGIGKEIARRIGSQPGWEAIIACRNISLGEEAASDLRSSGCPDVSVCHLDLDDPDTIASAANYVRETHGRLDALVNNAAVCFNNPTLYGKVAHTPFEKQAGITVRTNYFGTLGVTGAFLPLLKETAAAVKSGGAEEPSFKPRIVNIASSAGRLSILRSEERVEQFTSESLAVPALSSLIDEFIRDAEDGAHLDKGWPNTAYGVSKVGIIALTKILSRRNPDLLVNSVDPGYCRTDQNDNNGYVDPARGAITPFILATTPDEEVNNSSGGHFFEEKEISWWYQ